jgi:hypothetical protein
MSTVSPRAGAALALGVMVMTLAACATAPGSTQAPTRALCAGEGFSISIDFPGAGDHACTIDPAGVAVLQVRPEARPINPSPWFAFALDSVRDGEVRVRLVYDGAPHRYPPKWRDESGTWRALAASELQVSADGWIAELRILARSGRTLLAAQPVESAAEMIARARAVLKPAGFDERPYGRSMEGRPLTAFVAGPRAAEEIVVALTRQHPPERAGMVAFEAFAAEMAGARGARRVLLVPVVNPDGVDGGHWRGNAAGVDLNRDWGKFQQPETRALAALIEGEVKGRRLVALLDFHSTRHSVIYAPSQGRTPALDSAMAAFQQAYAAALPTPPPWSHAHDPASGTSKGWALERFGALGLTIEMADEASDEEARALGVETARAVASGLEGGMQR